MNSERSELLRPLPFYIRIWQGFAPPARLTGFTPRIVRKTGRWLSGGHRPPLQKSQQAGNPLAGQHKPEARLPAQLAPRLDGVSPSQCVPREISLVGRRSAEP